MVFGGYELDPVSRWEDGVPWDHAARSLAPDFERFAPLMAGAIRRFPFLGDAEVVRLVCHPDAMTPDANPLLGPLPGVRGFWVAAGMSLNGFGGGGRHRPGAERLDHGRRSGRRYRAVPRLALQRHLRRSDVRGRSRARGVQRLLPAPLPVRRGCRRPTTAPVAAARTPAGPRGGLRDEGGLGTTRSPRAGSAVAPFRARPGRATAGPSHRGSTASWRRAGPSGEQAGIIDLSSFGKIDVTGPQALAFLQRIAANDLDKPVGAVVYTPWCDERGGMVADVTVMRLAADRFRVVTGAGFVAVRPGVAALARRRRGRRASRTSAAHSRRSACGVRGHATSCVAHDRRRGG